MINQIITIDKKITFLLYSFFPHNSFFNYLFSFFSLKGISTLIWIIILIIILILEERKNPGISKKDKQFVFLFLISFISTVLIVELFLKNLFHRPRPSLTDFNRFQLISTDFNCPKDFSFPSGHAATAFTSAYVISFFDKKRRLFYYLIAFLISYSRIYLGCHYFFDVLVGGIIGYIISSQLFFLKRRC